MRSVYDEAKNEWNIRERNLSFDRAYDFDFDSAVLLLSPRHGEDRILAAGYLDDRLHILCFLDQGECLRVISFRKQRRRRDRRMAEKSEEYLANLTNDEGEVRELTGEDFKQFQPVSAFLICRSAWPH